MLACENLPRQSRDWPTPFSDRRDCREQKDFERLRDRAGYLRGPCSTLGVYRMEGNCARIEQLAMKENEPAVRNTAASCITEARKHFQDAEKAFHQLY